MPPLREAAKKHWKVVFQKAWDVIEVDVDRGGEEIASDETGQAESGKEMVYCLPQCFREGR